MSNVSGIEDNKTFRTGITTKDPYYYINASLDLTGLEVGAAPTNYIYYFNVDNNFDYLSSTLYPEGADSYPGFYPIEDNSVIGEIVVYTNPDVQYTYGGATPADLDFEIGGAYLPSLAESSLTPMDVWAGPTGNTPGPISGNQLKVAQVCHYGKEPQNPIASPLTESRKFLALNVYVGGLLARSSQRETVLGEVKSVSKVVQSRGKAIKVIRDTLTGDVLTGGKITVVVKVYPKFL